MKAIKLTATETKAWGTSEKLRHGKIQEAKRLADRQGRGDVEDVHGRGVVTAIRAPEGSDDRYRIISA